MKINKSIIKKSKYIKIIYTKAVDYATVKIKEVTEQEVITESSNKKSKTNIPQ